MPDYPRGLPNWRPINRNDIPSELNATSFLGDLLVKATGATNASPRNIGIDFAGGLAARFIFGDAFSSVGSAYGSKMVIQAYHGLEFFGGTGGNLRDFQSGNATSDPSVAIGTSHNDQHNLRLLGRTGKAGNFLEIQLDSGSKPYVIKPNGLPEINSPEEYIFRATSTNTVAGRFSANHTHPTETRFSNTQFTLLNNNNITWSIASYDPTYTAGRNFSYTIFNNQGGLTGQNDALSIDGVSCNVGLGVTNAPDKLSLLQGSLHLMNAAGTVKINNNQVLRARITGWSAGTGTVNRGAVSNSTTLTTLVQIVSTLINDLRTHGLIG